MPNHLKFLGHTESDAGLPDGSVVRVSPGDVIAYDGDLHEDGDVFWEVTTDGVTAEPADETAVAPVVLDPADDPTNSAPPLALPENLTPSYLTPDAPTVPAADTGVTPA